MAKTTKTEVETVDKYVNHLMQMRRLVLFNPHELRQKNKISNAFHGWLVKHGFMVRKGENQYVLTGIGLTNAKKIIAEYFHDQRSYMRAYNKRTRIKNKRKSERVGSVIEIPQKRNWTEQSAIDFLKKSTNYKYEIFRTIKEQL